ncbi:hypothetical protein ACT453_22475, partial [Bacillus sp. D-CC]
WEHFTWWYQFSHQLVLYRFPHRFEKFHFESVQLHVQLTVSDLGARITSLKVPTTHGLRELILGFDTSPVKLKYT